MSPKTRPDEDEDDIDDNPDEEDEQYGLPAALLAAAGVETDEDFDAIPLVKPNAKPLARLARIRKP
jgi:hypothetical protein